TDLATRTGTYVSGRRITGETVLADGDVIGCGTNGPALEFHTIEGEAAEQPGTTRASTRRDVFRATPASSSPTPPRRSSTAVRIAIAGAQLRRPPKVPRGLP